MNLEAVISPAGRTKSDKKRCQILESAARLFLASGFERTSMDAVAQESGVSKQTVYSHFKNKDLLYNAVIEFKCDSYQIDAQHFTDCDLPLLTLLEAFIDRMISLLQDPEVISMYASVIGESRVNSHIAQLFYDAGPKRSMDLLTHLFQDHPEAKLSELSAKELAVDCLNLLKAEYHMQGMLNLPFNYEKSAQKLLAQRVARKTLILKEHYSFE